MTSTSTITTDPADGGDQPQREHDGGVASLPGPEPTGPQWQPIRAIHRHTDGVITFHRKTADGEFENLFAISSKYLESMWPEFVDQLDTDTYFSINAYFHPEKRRHYIAATQARKPDRLRYLCAAFADLDCQNLGLDFGEAFAMILRAQEKGKIPPASIIMRSGRGLWLFWLLGDRRNPDLPCPAFPDKVRIYVDVNRVIGERLAEVGADPAARDALRLVRIAGSKNSRAKKIPEYLRVKYWVQCGADGKPAVYTLDKLAEFFGANLPRLDAPSKRALTEAKRAPGDRLRGHVQLNARRLREFNLLWVSRGGFQEGCRARAALIYGWLLHRNGLERSMVAAEVERFALACRPELGMADRGDAMRTIFSSTKPIRRLRDQTISDWLDISPAESKMLERLPPASRFGIVELHPEPATSINAEQRRRLIDQLIGQFGVRSSRSMARLLAEQDCPVSYRTVQTDYRSMGIIEAKKP